MEATIINYRRNSTGQVMNQLVVTVLGIDTKDKAHKFVGKNATLSTGKQNIIGKVSGIHGNTGALRILFLKGIPGQMLGSKLLIE